MITCLFLLLIFIFPVPYSVNKVIIKRRLVTNQIYRLLRNYNVIRVGREVENQLEYIKVNTTHIRIEKD